jgi:hypothetical protein
MSNISRNHLVRLLTTLHQPATLLDHEIAQLAENVRFLIKQKAEVEPTPENLYVLRGASKPNNTNTFTAAIIVGQQKIVETAPFPHRNEALRFLRTAVETKVTETLRDGQREQKQVLKRLREQYLEERDAAFMHAIKASAEACASRAPGPEEGSDRLWHGIKDRMRAWDAHHEPASGVL